MKHKGKTRTRTSKPSKVIQEKLRRVSKANPQGKTNEARICNGLAETTESEQQCKTGESAAYSTLRVMRICQSELRVSGRRARSSSA